VESSLDTSSLFAVAVVAAIAPFVVDLPRRIAVPVVVVEIALGILVGPQVLGIVDEDVLIEFLGQFGLAFLFFMAGLEIDFKQIRGRPTQLAARGWVLSVALGFAVAGLLHVAGIIVSDLLVGAAMATTALGALMPILHDAGEVDTRFGTFVVAAGAVGEFGPIVLVALLLTPTTDRIEVVLLLIAFTVVAVAAAIGGARMSDDARHRLAKTMHSTAQLPMRLSLLLLVGLVFLAREFGLDLILGAFAAGIVVGLASKGPEAEPLKVKLEGMGFGFFIPVFFISTGMNFDLKALFEGPGSLFRLPLFLALFLLVRGLPALLLYRRELPAVRERAALALFSATALPLVVAITEIGVRTGRMRSETAAALVGAGMLSVFVFPLLGLRLRRPAGASGAEPDGAADARPA
jgi:Kef-type K+ transport system membrane component KefB